MTVKATFNLKAANMGSLTKAVEAIAAATGSTMTFEQTVSTSIVLEVRTMKDLQQLLTNIATALSLVGGVEVSVKTPADVYNGLRLDPTPIEQAIAHAAQEALPVEEEAPEETLEQEALPEQEADESLSLDKFRDVANGTDSRVPPETPAKDNDDGINL